MKLSEMCRKLETEEEKVLPFYATSLTPEEEEQVASQAEEPCSEELAEVKREKIFVRKCDFNMTPKVFFPSHTVYWSGMCRSVYVCPNIVVVRST